MRIGFDLDGVIAEVSIVEWLLTGKVKKEESEVIYQFLHIPKLLHHPRDFLHESDEYIIITGRARKYRGLTEKWLRSFGINSAVLYMCDVGNASDYNSIEEFFDAMGKSKAKIIKRECIEVYFEDSPAVVERLRKLCPKVKIIQYGGRLK